MILGNSSGAGASGNMRSGYSTAFLPCRAMAFPAAVATKFNSGRGFTYSAYCEVQNSSGDWVTIGEASYFQVNKSPDGSSESANITIQNSIKWSPFGSTYPDLLKPSNRLCRIVAKADSFNFTPIYTGKIVNYMQPEGFKGGSINLTLQDIRSVLQRESGVEFEPEQSLYHNARIQLHSKLRSIGSGFSAEMADSTGTITSAGTRYDNVSASIPGKKWYNTSNGVIVISTSDIQTQKVTTGIVRLTDDNITTATRSLNDANMFNSVRVQGDDSGTLTTETVEDAADVADRGAVFYAAGIIGGSAITIAQARAIASAMIAESLAGSFSFQTAFMPYFDAGQIVYVQSDRFEIPASYATLTRVRHQYRVGSCVTYLDRVTIGEVI